MYKKEAYLFIVFFAMYKKEAYFFMVFFGILLSKLSI